MSAKYKNVYLQEAATVVGPYEKNGPLSRYFDKKYDDLYCGADSWEKAEVKLLQESLNLLLKKKGIKKDKIDLVISGDLLNQITASSYAGSPLNAPFLGIYSACATSMEAMILASTFIDSKRKKNVVIATSSHNMSSEKQFRNPTEYGAPKPMTATFTATGGASLLLSDEKSSIKVESGTIGRIVDYNQTDPFNMGAVMAGAAADTIYRHLTDMKRDASYYDLILTGDLGKYGKEILKDYMMEEYKIDLSKNYNDCGVILYDTEKQPQTQAGGSGPVCSALVNFTMVLDKLKKKELKRVLLVATGALFSPTFVYQKENILSIAHAISLEAVE